MRKDHFLPDDKFRPEMIEMVGKRYGRLYVMAHAGRSAYITGRGIIARYPLYRVRCDCGNEFVVDGRRLRHPSTPRGSPMTECVACTHKRTARKQSVQLPSGRTLAEIRQTTGVDIDTIYKRYIRGWPEEDLGLPVFAKGKDRFSRNRAAGTTRGDRQVAQEGTDGGAAAKAALQAGRRGRRGSAGWGRKGRQDSGTTGR